MNRTLITSSHLRSIGYDYDKQILEVEFHNGQVFQYLDVSKKKYEDMMKAPSIGSFFSHFVKPAHALRRVEG